MASYFILPLTQLLILLFSYVTAAIIADQPAIQEQSLYQPQPKDFINDHLYSAYLVIQRFKKTITSDPKNITASWSGHDICGDTSYLGFYCVALPGQTKKPTVTVVIFNGYKLSAPKLNGFIDQLPDLALFHAASNNFGGDIPLLAGLTYNYKLNVERSLQTQDNRQKPDTVGTRLITGVHTHCINIDLDITFHLRPGNGNKGTAKIPGATDSKALLLNYNNLSGPLSAKLGFSKLSYLALANNKLTGPIPQSISHLQESLLEVLLLNNQLTGCLPHELGMLHKAAVIDASTNQLTGPIPSSFSCLSSVEQLNLAGNRLYGNVPDALCKLAAAGRLSNLTLSGNYFTSVGPACAALIKDGVMDVKNNCIPGLANQRRPAECAAFQSLPKTCPAATTQVTCPAAAPTNAAAPAERKARDYSSYVTYATLHD